MSVSENIKSEELNKSCILECPIGEEMSPEIFVDSLGIQKKI